MNAIELHGLEKHYKDFDLKIDLELPQGCILGLVGENGAGKSTTIRMLLGMTQPDGGSVRVRIEPMDPSEPSELRSLEELSRFSNVEFK